MALSTGAGVLIDGGPLSLADVERVARCGVPVSIGASAVALMEASRRVVEAALDDGEAHYGINTGFGSLARTRIPRDELAELQRNLIRSHAAGVGEALGEDVVRAMLLILAGSLCRGLSGVRPALAHRIVDLLNAGVTPVVPSIGSVGASGDLAPLAHAALVLIGEGEAFVGGERLVGGEALRRAGVEAIGLEAKEGLALINGTHLMAAQAALLCADFDRVVTSAALACAMSIDSNRATDEPLHEAVQLARGQNGQRIAAEAIRGHLAGSAILPSHRENDPRVQDPYSIRCAAPVVGAAIDAGEYVRSVVTRELGAVTDNPLILRIDGTSRIVSAGNFHGMPLAIPLDALAIAMAHIAGIAERRVFLMLSARDPEAGLTPYLAAHPGLQSGLMIAQYTAAACCNEIIGLCTPASVANLPTSAGTEDYNSFGPRAAAKARRVLELTKLVVAIEFLCAAEALEHQRPLRSGAGVERAHAIIRGVAPALASDRPPGPDIEAIAGLIAEGALAGSRPDPA
ncbi:MAG: histidine ammonia-lyase [Phycisphaeraceae bacterium]|nr:histidine ammonia-lyase [Phycisphaeraceae bacterium]